MTLDLKGSCTVTTNQKTVRNIELTDSDTLILPLTAANTSNVTVKLI